MTRIVVAQEFCRETDKTHYQEIRHAVSQLDKHMRMLEMELRLQRDLLKQLLPEYKKLIDEKSDETEK